METVNVPKEDWKTLVSSVADIRNTLAGSKELGTTGFIHKVDKIETRLNELENTDNKRKGVLWVLGILWIGLVAIAGWIISINKH